MHFLELTLRILLPYTILQFSLYFLPPENPWLKSSLVSNKHKELLLPLLQKSSSSKCFVHIGSTVGPMQKTTFLGVAVFLNALCSWQYEGQTHVHAEPSLKFTHQKRTRDYRALFYQEKRAECRIHCDTFDT